jgi:predicted 3-demethylubiquinone-9 3-methyltransferase (glyoxalase superfamily)
MNKIHPFLWFEVGAEDAADRYVEIFGGTILGKWYWGPGGAAPEGSLISVRFEIDGREYEAFEGGPNAAFNDSFSIWVTVDSQEELDRVWDALTAGGGEGVACGWLRDRWGLRWQVVPSILGELMRDPDPGRSSRATQAMLHMVKLDFAALQAAADG